MLAEIRTLLAAENYFVVIGSAAGHAQAIEGAAELPCAYVVMIDRDPEPSTLIQLTRQEVTVSFDVLIGLQNLADQRGEAVSDDLEAAQKVVERSVLGKTLTDAMAPIQYAGGYLFGYDQAVLWWADRYTYKILIGGPQQ